ncbi:hypothetical protein [Vibrio parahaemolyticus]|uniref:hypothetical protein n=1 Tax=Vibrio parahaemolyticus TaxID=670 RepID=UPI001E288BC4|nr:hypothetical protein [Vibrio parahaemolyticus]
MLKATSCIASIDGSYFALLYNGLVMGEFKKIIISCVITAVLSFFVAFFFWSKGNERTLLDVATFFEPDFISKPVFPHNDISLSVDGVEHEKLGLMNISVVNFSNKDFSDLPITVKIKSHESSEFQILAASGFGTDGTPELVKLTREHSKGNVQQYEFIVSTLSRVEGKKDYGFQLRLLIKGESESEPEVKVIPKGVSTRKYSEKNSPEYNDEFRTKLFYAFCFSVLLIIITAIITIFVILPISSLLTKSSTKEYYKRRVNSYYDVVKNQNLCPESDDSQIKALVSNLYYYDRLKFWENQNWFMRFSQAFIKPEKQDFEI